MKWSVLAICIILAQQPAKPPESSRRPESKRTQVGQVANASNGNEQNSSNSAPVPQQVLVYENAPASGTPNATPSNEDENIQGSIRTFTGLLVLVGLVQAVILLMQWCMYRRQSKHFEASERAWLTVDVENFDPATEHDRILFVNVTIRNCGKTPARIKQMVVAQKQIPIPAETRPRPGELPPTPDYSDESATATVEGRDLIVAPGGVFPYMHISISQENFASVKREEVSLYVYGFVEYFDTIKGNEHVTDFCAIYWTGNKFLTEPTGFTFASIIPPAYFRAT